MSPSEAREFWKKSQQDLLFTQATALAYTTLLSLIPILAVAFFFFKAFGGLDSLVGKMQPLIEENLAPAFSDKISVYMSQFLNNVHAGAVGILGIIGFIFTSITTLATIEKTFNIIWGVRNPRTWGYRITTYWSLLTVGPICIAVSLMVSSKAYVWLKHDSGAISQVLVWGFALAPYLSSSALFSALFLFMPNVTIGKKDAFRAGAITGLIFEVAKYLYALYATRSIASNAIYGSLAVFPVFLLWLYVVWLIILFGAELCCYFHFKSFGIPYRFNYDERLNAFVTADILEELSHTNQKPRGGMTIPQMISILKIPVFELLAHLNYLEKEGWVLSSKQTFKRGRKYHLAVQASQIDLSKILQKLNSQYYVPKGHQSMEMHKRLQDWASGWGTVIKGTKKKSLTE